MTSHRGHLPECESLRGIAIVLVFCFHYLGSLRGYEPYDNMPAGAGLLYGGNTGVILFFVLSGFLLSRPFLLGAPLNPGSYLLRRALRILPMFYLLVLLAGLWSGQWWQALNALFFHGIRVGILSPMGNVWWSLVVEVQFYLILPIAVWLARSPRYKPLLWLLVPATCYAYWQVCVSGLEPGFWAQHRDSILGRWPLFAVGVLLAWTHTHLAAWTPRLSEHGWLGLLLVIAALVSLNFLTEHRVRTLGMYAHVFWYEHYLLEALAWGAFILALLNFRFPGYRLLVNPLFHSLGLWSYSIYLIHSSVIYFMLKADTALRLSWRPDGWGETALLGIALFLLSASISAVTYRWIELPFLQLKSMPWSKSSKQGSVAGNV